MMTKTDTMKIKVPHHNKRHARNKSNSWFNVEIKTDYDALVLALELATTAPTDEKVQACLDEIKKLNVTACAVARAKKEVEEINRCS